jgi:Flp pilus assembly protein TadG
MRYRVLPRAVWFREERGAVALELSLVLLLMLTLIFGIIEVGRLMFAYTTLAGAARAGTRYATVHGANSSSPSYNGNSGSVSTQVTDLATSAGLTGVTVAVAYPNNTGGAGSDPNGNLTGDVMTVTASYSFSPIVSLIPLGTFTISSQSQSVICY